MNISKDIAQAASTMKATQLQTEASFKVMKMNKNLAEQEGAGLMKLIDAAMTGIGQNIDTYV